MSGSRALQKVLKVAYLGPEYSYSHLAAIERFGQAVEFLGVSNIAAVFEEVERGHVDFGVVPVENSTDGRIADTLEMFLRMPHLVICAEVRLQIHHNLMAKCEPQEIRRVYSKPQALSQCRNWLAKNVPQALLEGGIQHGDGGRAGLSTSRGPPPSPAGRPPSGMGCASSSTDIEDSPYNETRFAVIGHQKSGKTGTDKTAIMFRMPHHPGSLVRGAGGVQAEQDQPDMDRVVPRPASRFQRQQRQIVRQGAQAGVSVFRRF